MATSPRDDEKVDPAWIASQKVTFTKWCNRYLAEKKYPLIEGDIAKAFESGTQLIYLISAVYGTPLPKFKADPKIKPQKLDNITLAMNMLDQNEVRTNALQPEHIFECNEKMILGLMWTVILDHSIGDIKVGEKKAKEGLLLWVNGEVKNYPKATVTNFHKDFKSGLTFCALIHSKKPELFDYNSLSEDFPKRNLELAFDLAEKHFHVPKLLEAQDIVNSPKPDDKSIMAYVAEFFHAFANLETEEAGTEKLKQYIAFHKQLLPLVQSYRSISDPGSWAEEKAQWFTSPEDFKEYAVQPMTTYYASEKPAHNAERFKASELFNHINSFLLVNINKEFTPSDVPVPSRYEASWANLEKSERSFKKIEGLIADFEKNARKLLQWSGQQAADFKSKSGEESKDKSSSEAQLSSIKSFWDQDLKAQFTHVQENLELLAEIVKECQINRVPEYSADERKLGRDTVDESFSALVSALRDRSEQLQKHIRACDAESGTQAYDNQAAQLAAWQQDQLRKLQENVDYKNEDHALNDRKEVEAFLSQDLEKKIADKKALDIVFAAVQANLEIDSNPLYTPVHGRSLEELGDAFKAIRAAAVDRLKRVEAYLAEKRLRDIEQAFVGQAAQFLNKCDQLKDRVDLNKFPLTNDAQVADAESFVLQYESTVRKQVEEELNALLHQYHFADLEGELDGLKRGAESLTYSKPRLIEAVEKLQAEKLKYDGAIYDYHLRQRVNNLQQQYEGAASDFNKWTDEQIAGLQANVSFNSYDEAYAELKNLRVFDHEERGVKRKQARDNIENSFAEIQGILLIRGWDLYKPRARESPQELFTLLNVRLYDAILDRARRVNLWIAERKLRDLEAEYAQRTEALVAWAFEQNSLFDTKKFPIQNDEDAANAESKYKAYHESVLPAKIKEMDEAMNVKQHTEVLAENFQLKLATIPNHLVPAALRQHFDHVEESAKQFRVDIDDYYLRKKIHGLIVVYEGKAQEWRTYGSNQITKYLAPVVFENEAAAHAEINGCKEFRVQGIRISYNTQLDQLTTELSAIQGLLEARGWDLYKTPQFLSPEELFVHYNEVLKAIHEHLRLCYLWLNDKRLRDLEGEYRNSAASLVDWANTQFDKLDPVRNPIKNDVDCKQAENELQQYRDALKPQRKDQFNKLLCGKRYLEALAANFSLQLTPIPPELSPAALRDHFARVEAQSFVFEKAIFDYYLRKDLDARTVKFRGDADGFSKWSENENNRLKRDVSYASEEGAIADINSVRSFEEKDIGETAEKNLYQVVDQFTQIRGKQERRGWELYVSEVPQLSPNGLYLSLESTKACCRDRVQRDLYWIARRKLGEQSTEFTGRLDAVKSWAGNQEATFARPITNDDECSAAEQGLAVYFKTTNPAKINELEEAGRVKVVVETGIQNWSVPDMKEELSVEDSKAAVSKVKQSAFVRERKIEEYHLEKRVAAFLAKFLTHNGSVSSQFNHSSKSLDVPLNNRQDCAHAWSAVGASKQLRETSLEREMVDGESQWSNIGGHLERYGRGYDFVDSKVSGHLQVRAVRGSDVSLKEKEATLIKNILDAEDGLELREHQADYVQRAENTRNWIVGETNTLQKAFDDHRTEDCYAIAQGVRGNSDKQAQPVLLWTSYDALKRESLYKGKEFEPVPANLLPKAIFSANVDLLKNSEDLPRSCPREAFAAAASPKIETFEQRQAQLINGLQNKLDVYTAKAKALAKEENKSLDDEASSFFQYLRDEKGPLQAEYYALRALNFDILKDCFVGCKPAYASAGTLSVESADRTFGALQQAEADFVKNLFRARLEAARRDRNATPTDEQLAKLEDIFKHFDADNSGDLDYNEFRAAVSALGVFLTDEEFEATFRRLSHPAKITVQDRQTGEDKLVDTRLVAKLSFSDFYIHSLFACKTSDVIIAMRTLTKKADVCAEEHLRSSDLTEEEIQHLMQVMPSVAGGWNHKLWIENERAQKWA
eukprot:TRINITY_DN1408_c0_g1_i1.p1 TRINITY_DN1408_c0_g1~~TRINITY_DN1408_c0_g1_i1.p1  ORF type:complete len:1961 (-),score=559.26 TRINITY_DN1408_c0_g1_i1:60-5942(-)